MARRPSAVQKNFMAGLGIVIVFAALIGSGFLLQKNNDTLSGLIKKNKIKDDGQGSWNDMLAGVTFYSAILVGIYGIGSLIMSNEELKIYLPYIVSLVSLLLFAMIAYLGTTLILNQIDINEGDPNNSVTTNYALGAIYILVAVGGLGFTLFKHTRPSVY